MKCMESPTVFHILLDLGKLQTSYYFCIFHASGMHFLAPSSPTINLWFCHLLLARLNATFRHCVVDCHVKLSLHRVLEVNKYFRLRFTKAVIHMVQWEMSGPIPHPWAAPQCRSTCLGLASFRQVVHQSSLVLHWPKPSPPCLLLCCSCSSLNQFFFSMGEFCSRKQRYGRPHAGVSPSLCNTGTAYCTGGGLLSMQLCKPSLV